MAKRKRLDFDSVTRAPAPEVKSMTPPIANVAGAAAAAAAEGDVVAELTALREAGRVILGIPVKDIVADHLVRDRVSSGTGDEDMEALIASILTHGQRTPIEVVELQPGQYGLISGWRRLTALRHLAHKGPHFETVLAIVRQPVDAGDAYVAMVEENEIRADLSHYERARIAVEAAAAGAFSDAETAVNTLFAAGSKAKRSKIRSFMAIHATLGDVLRFPSDLPERLGLRLAQAIKAGEGQGLRAALATPASDAAGEAAALTKALETPAAKPVSKRGKSEVAPQRRQISETLTLEVRTGKSGREVILSGAEVTDEFAAKLATFLSET